jgi:hypothetical protein
VHQNSSCSRLAPAWLARSGSPSPAYPCAGASGPRFEAECHRNGVRSRRQTRRPVPCATFRCRRRCRYWRGGAIGTRPQKDPAGRSRTLSGAESQPSEALCRPSNPRVWRAAHCVAVKRGVNLAGRLFVRQFGGADRRMCPSRWEGVGSPYRVTGVRVRIPGGFSSRPGTLVRGRRAGSLRTPRRGGGSSCPCAAAGSARVGGRPRRWPGPAPRRRR